MDRYEQLIGQVFDGKYRIDALLGVGGMAVVMKGYDIKNERDVAIKMLKEEMTDDKQAVKRFVTESKAVAMLNHPNIVKAYDVVITDETKYLVMGYIEGETLRNYMDKVGKIPFEKCLSIVGQLLSALSHIAEKGVVHRDIKPHNILMTKSGKVILTDFGIAKISDSEEGTVDEKAIGTVYYISPEQAAGGEIDHRSDIYSLGVMLYEMLTGQLPFVGESTAEIAMKHISIRPTSPRELLPTIPKGMEQLVLYAMEKNPDDRFRSAEQMAKYLEVLEKDPFAEFAIVPKDQYKIYLEEQEKSKNKPEEEKKQPPEREVISKKGDSWSFMPIMLGIICAFTVVLIVSGYYAVKNIFWDSDLNVFRDRSGENVVIEDYVGKRFTEETKNYLVDRKGYYKVNIIYETNKTVEKDHVISQQPDPGSVRKLATVELTVVVSKGYNEIEHTFPDYRMQDYRQVRQILLDKGYTVILEPMENSAINSCLIIDTVPPAGSKIERDITEVKIYYSAGPNAEQLMFTFPNFVGLKEAEAAYYFNAYELNLEKVERVYSNEVEAGRVISCNITAGPKPKLTPISLVISLGPDPNAPVSPSESDSPLDSEPDSEIQTES